MIDQDKMRALAKAAPGGGWETWTSNSWRRVYAGGNPAITPCVHPHDNHPDLTFAPGVREWIEAATPDVIVALLDKMDAMESENNRLRAELEAAAADKRKLMAAIEVVHRRMRDEDDCGPYGEGWQSEEIRDAWNVIDAALAQRQGEGS